VILDNDVKLTITEHHFDPMHQRNSYQIVMASDFDAVCRNRDDLLVALRSIAANSCCGSCHEAAAVARAALKGAE
jgi:hypothetical protein